jgi:hypothetical protein
MGTSTNIELIKQIQFRLNDGTVYTYPSYSNTSAPAYTYDVTQGWEIDGFRSYIDQKCNLVDFLIWWTCIPNDFYSNTSVLSLSLSAVTGGS